MLDAGVGFDGNRIINPRLPPHIDAALAMPFGDATKHLRLGRRQLGTVIHTSQVVCPSDARVYRTALRRQRHHVRQVILTLRVGRAKLV
jgi:hypothetical protein